MEIFRISFSENILGLLAFLHIAWHNLVHEQAILTSRQDFFYYLYWLFLNELKGFKMKISDVLISETQIKLPSCPTNASRII